VTGAFAQTPTWDSTGDSLLSGTYYFRDVVWAVSASNGGVISDEGALYGTITFDGAGKYTISAQFLDIGQSSISPETLSGTYSIGAGGFGFLSHPLLSGAVIRGMVSNGIFIGSGTESGSFNDLFIAGQIPSPSPTLSTFNGTYAMAYVNYPYSQNPAYFNDAQFTLNPNGAGSLGNVSIRGYFAGNGTTVTGQVASGVKYIASGGAIVMTFPNASQNTLSLVNGQEYLYFSPDGNFVFGGSPQQADMMIGVRTTTGGAPQLLNSSLYYNAGAYSDATQLASAGALDLDTYYGSFNVSGGNIIQHSRIFSSVFSGTYSSVTTGTVPTTAGATYSDPTDNYTVGNGGNVRIGFGIPPYLGIDIALAAPSFSGTNVYLNPVGVVNAGSYAPFTTGLSPGELIVLTGTNIAPAGALQVATTATFPNKINGVQVLIDGIAAPIYYVSATQIAAIVPYAASTFGIATVQVNNNGVKSNIVTEFVNTTTPGVLTSPANGISVAAALHGDYSLVSERSPALAGETISVYLTGLGAVFPPIQDGFPGSSDSTSLNNTTNTIAAAIGGMTATVGYAGLAPGFAGLYQINITIPAGLTAGDNYLQIEGPDSFSEEALIPIGSGTAAGFTPVGTEVQNGQAQKPAKHWKPRPTQKNVVVNPVQP
jgi:uncharacterized protein (TIGR03437 family)